MKRLLLLFLQLCLIGTLLLWLWLLWQTWNPALVFVPSAVVYVGFTVLPARRQPDPLGCLDAFSTLSRLAVCFAIVFVVPHLVQFLSSLLLTSAGLGGPPAPPTLLDRILQGATQLCYWVTALLVALMAVSKLPWIE